MSNTSSDGGATQRGPLLPRADLTNQPSPEDDDDDEGHGASHDARVRSGDTRKASSAAPRAALAKPPQPPPRKQQYLPVQSSGYGGTSRAAPARAAPAIERRPPSPVHSVASSGSVRSFGSSSFGSSTCRLRHGDGTPAGDVSGRRHLKKQLPSGPAAPSPRAPLSGRRRSFPHPPGGPPIAPPSAAGRPHRRFSTSSPVVAPVVAPKRRAARPTEAAMPRRRARPSLDATAERGRPSLGNSDHSYGSNGSSTTTNNNSNSNNNNNDSVTDASGGGARPPLPPSSPTNAARPARGEYKDYGQVDAEDPTPVKEARRLTSLFHSRGADPPLPAPSGPTSPPRAESGGGGPTAQGSSPLAATSLFAPDAERVVPGANADAEGGETARLAARLFSAAGLDAPGLARLLRPMAPGATKQWELRKRLDEKEEELAGVRTALGELSAARDAFAKGAARVEEGLRRQVAETRCALEAAAEENRGLETRTQEGAAVAATRARERDAHATRCEVLASELEGARREAAALREASTEGAVRLALAETRREEAARGEEAARQALTAVEAAREEAVRAAEARGAERRAALERQVGARRTREEEVCRLIGADVAAAEDAGGSDARADNPFLAAVKRRWEELQADVMLQEEMARDLERCDKEMERVKADHQAALETLATKDHDMSQLTKSIGDIQRFNRDRELEVAGQCKSAEDRAATFERQVVSLGYEKKAFEEALEASKTECAAREGTIAELQGGMMHVKAENERLRDESRVLTMREEEVCRLLNVDAAGAATNRQGGVEGDTEDLILSSLKSKLKGFQDETKLMEELARELEICSGKLERLKADYEAALETLATKDREMGELTKSIGDMQRSSQERERVVVNQRTEAEDRAATAKAQVAEYSQKLTALDCEKERLKEAMNSSQEACLAHESTITTLQNEMSICKTEIAAKTSLLARAQEKESEERSECIALSAQFNAQRAEHNHSKKQMRSLLETTESKLKDQLRRHQQESTEKDAEIVKMGETITMLESSNHKLKETVSQQVENASNKEEIGRLQGKIANLEARLGMEANKLSIAKETTQERMRELKEAVRLGQAERKRLHNTIQELRGNVRVFARIRPFLPDDGKHSEEDGAPFILHESGDTVTITKSSDPSKKHRFPFDRVFGPSSGQEAVFNEVSEFVQSSLDGYNVTLFSYGQTGSGKTFTMMGTGDGLMRGLIPRSIQKIAAHKKQLTIEGWTFSMEVEFLEIYNECVRDLLRTENAYEGELKHEIKVDGEGRRTVTNLTVKSIDPSNCDAIRDLLTLAAKRRSTAATDMNAESSRSHSVFTVRMTAKHEGRNQAVHGTLNLVDLAGSERLNRSNAEGQQAKEAISINKSLSSLTDVFTAIGQKQSHVPFRHSRLTYLLQPSLSGDGKTLMLVNISPTEASVQESLCSLRFASRVNKCELGKAKRSIEELKHTKSEVGGSKNKRRASKPGSRHVKHKM